MRATEFYKTILDHINRNHPNPDVTFYSGALLNDLGQRRPRFLFCHQTQATLDELHTLLGIDPEKWNAAYDKMVSGEWQQLNTYPGPSGDTPEAYATKAVWLMTLPHISVVDGTQIAHYESVDKLNREIETRIRYGRYLTNVMKITDPRLTSRVSRLNSGNSRCHSWKMTTPKAGWKCTAPAVSVHV